MLDSTTAKSFFFAPAFAKNVIIFFLGQTHCSTKSEVFMPLIHFKLLGKTPGKKAQGHEQCSLVKLEGRLPSTKV
jgi:hypothetical protein